MEQYEKELRELFTDTNRNTKRKRKNSLNNELSELQYIIDHIEPQLEAGTHKDMLGVFAWHLGDKKRKSHLRTLKAQHKFITENFDRLCVLS